MFFWNSLAFSIIQRMLAIWSFVPLPFLKWAWTSGSSWFTYCWSLAWRILSITLLACEMSAIVQWFKHSLVLPFFGIGMKTDLFQSCSHCWVSQICWHLNGALSQYHLLGFEIAVNIEGAKDHQFLVYGMLWKFLRWQWVRCYSVFFFFFN